MSLYSVKGQIWESHKEKSAASAGIWVHRRVDGGATVYEDGSSFCPEGFSVSRPEGLGHYTGNPDKQTVALTQCSQQSI